MGAMPVRAGLYFGLSIVTAPSPDVTSQHLGEAVTYYAIPWWVKAIEVLASIPVIGGIGMVVLIFGLKHFNVI